ncbi:helix-turn-helix transcriptional regulator [Archangium minus]|uniref:Helix-turn-helix transcriptional regulator n=2 Tax=Archangiaceae TaxID=39 RepID=A0ABY9XCC7_9BACT|nr:helix-turn-helix transcriptional regulator [Archangium violaceum]WNG53077.1 helix-turn-helix transcriptional regulator [Archangium minus]
MSLAAATHAARIRAELTMAEVARRVGVQLEVYGRIERGEMLPNIPTLRRICVALEILPDELLGLASPESPDRERSSDMRRLKSAVRGLGAAELRLLHQLADSLRPIPRE